MTQRKGPPRKFQIAETDAPLIESLKPEHQAVLRAQGSYVDMAECLNIPIGTVKSRYHRAVAAIKAMRAAAQEESTC